MSEHEHDNNDDCELEPFTPAEPTPTQPLPLLEGTFAIFVTPNDQLLVVWCKKGEEKDNYLPIPPVVMHMASQVGGITLDDIKDKIASGNFG